MRALLLILLLAGCHRGPAPPPPGPSTEAFTIVHVGDINLAEDVTPILEKDGADFMFRALRPDLRGDLLVGNLETVAADEPASERIHKGSIHLMDPKYLQTIQAEGFGLVNLANNHAMDQRGPDLVEMIAHLDAIGLPHVGAGADLKDASAPFLVEGGGLRIAILGMYWYSAGKNTLGWYASADGPGVRPIDKRSLTRQIRALKAGGIDFVLASVHWGPNYHDETKKLRSLARDLVAAGVDGVNGHGAHRQQGVEIVDGVPVLYGIGNLAFGSKGIYARKSPHNRVSSIARWVFQDGRLQRIELLPIATDNRIVRYQARRADVAQAKAEFEPTLDRYHVPWTRRDDGWYVLPAPERPSR